MNQFTTFRSTAVLAVVAILLMAGAGFSTNGYFAHGYGTQYKALAGAGTALSLNSLAAATNPAAMAFVGKRIDVGAAFFNPNREFTVTGNPSNFPGTFGLAPGTVSSGSTLFLVPSAGVNLSLPGGHNLGLSIYGNGGMNTDYDSPVFGAKPTGVNLSQLFVGATYSREIVPNHAIGVTGIFAYQMFEAKGLAAFGNFSGDPANLSDNGNDNATGFGVRVGYLGKILPALSIGASYQTKIAMGEFKKYAGLFAEKGDFDIPATWSVGVAVKATPILTLAADVQQILYSDIKSIANPLDLVNNSPMTPSGNPNPNFKPLGDPDGWGFGWEDVTVYKVGAQVTPMPGFTLRAGYSMCDQPIPDTEMMFNILAPGVVEKHATFGVSKTILPTLQVHFSLMRAFSNSVQGPNMLEAPNQQKIELKMDQWDGEIGVSFAL